MQEDWGREGQSRRLEEISGRAVWWDSSSQTVQPEARADLAAAKEGTQIKCLLWATASPQASVESRSSPSLTYIKQWLGAGVVCCLKVVSKVKEASSSLSHCSIWGPIFLKNRKKKFSLIHVFTFKDVLRFSYFFFNISPGKILALQPGSPNDSFIFWTPHTHTVFNTWVSLEWLTEKSPYNEPVCWWPQLHYI